MGNMERETAARSRIDGLLDAGSFVEIGGAMTARSTDFNMPEKETPADGVLTGYGLIHGALAFVYSQDATVLGGAIGEMHAKKIARIYDMAVKMGAPVIGLIDCAGLRLQEATDALEGFGELYRKQADASGAILQIAAIFGTCGGGLALVPGLADFTFMEEEKARLFVNAPNAVHGNEISGPDTSSAKFQSEVTGLVDGIGSTEEILSQIRTLVEILPATCEEESVYGDADDDINRVCPELANATEDTAIALAQISDEQFFFETKRDYAKDMVTGFIRLNGLTVGAVANRSGIYNEQAELVETFDGGLSAKGAEKAADFVNFCDAFGIPVLTLTNVSGFDASECSEKHLAKAAARLTYAFANATVAKVNVIIGKAYGSAYVAMNSKSLGADLVFAWPQAQIGMMDAALAAKIMYPDEDAAGQQEKAAAYQALQNSPAAAASRGYADKIIEPADTRKYVLNAFDMLYMKRENRPEKKHGSV